MDTRANVIADGTTGERKSDTTATKTMANIDVIKWAIGVTGTNAVTIGETVVG